MTARHLVDSACPREPRARKGLEDGGLPWALAWGGPHGQPSLIPFHLDLQNSQKDALSSMCSISLEPPRTLCSTQHQPLTQRGHRGPGRKSGILHWQRSLSPGAKFTGVQERFLHNVNFKTGSQEPSVSRVWIGGICWPRAGPGNAVRRIGRTGFDFKPHLLLTHNLVQHISLFDCFSSSADWRRQDMQSSRGD